MSSSHSEPGSSSVAMYVTERILVHRDECEGEDPRDEDPVSVQRGPESLFFLTYYRQLYCTAGDSAVPQERVMAVRYRTAKPGFLSFAVCSTPGGRRWYRTVRYRTTRYVPRSFLYRYRCLMHIPVILIRIRADEGARERTRTFKIRLVLAAPGRDIPIKRADRHAIIYYVLHQQARWDNADSGSYLIR